MIKILDLNFLGNSQTIASFLVETVEGPVLVETGPHSALPHLEKGLAGHGYQLADIKHVFLSHIHLDHAGAAWAFAQAGAKIYVHPIGAPHLIDPSRLMSSAKMIYQEKMDMLWGEMRSIPREQVIAVADKSEIIVGDSVFQAWHTPGHATHHIAWQFGSVLFTGDVAGVKIGNTGLVVPPCPPPDINVEHWQASIALLKNLNLEALYLTHYGKVTDVNNHLEALESILLAWAAWIKPRWARGEAPEAVIPDFEKYVESQLQEIGLNDVQIARYNAANPPDMSVTGLMRYWRKSQQV